MRAHRLFVSGLAFTVAAALLTLALLAMHHSMHHGPVRPIAAERDAR